MFLFREPGTADVRDYLNDRTLADFNYREVGASNGRRPQGYNIDRHRIELGRGLETFERARKGIRDWRQFGLLWVRLCWPFKKIQVGVSVAVLAQHFGFWSMNSARISYAIDEPRRFGFGYGTVSDHMMHGEERFLVEWRDDDSVWYEISSFSRPGHWLLWTFYPFMRQRQRRFARESCHAMAAVAAGDNVTRLNRKVVSG